MNDSLTMEEMDRALEIIGRGADAPDERTPETWRAIEDVTRSALWRNQSMLRADVLRDRGHPGALASNEEWEAYFWALRTFVSQDHHAVNAFRRAVRALISTAAPPEHAQ